MVGGTLLSPDYIADQTDQVRENMRQPHMVAFLNGGQPESLDSTFTQSQKDAFRALTIIMPASDLDAFLNSLPPETAKAAVNIPAEVTQYGEMPTLLGMFANQNNPSKITVLANHGADLYAHTDPTIHQTALHAAERIGATEAADQLRELEKHFGEVGKLDQTTDGEGKTPSEVRDDPRLVEARAALKRGVTSFAESITKEVSRANELGNPITAKQADHTGYAAEVGQGSSIPISGRGGR